MFCAARCVDLPDGLCPNNRHDWSVKNGAGDLMLCPDCDRTRFEQNTRNKDSVVVANDDAIAARDPGAVIYPAAATSANTATI